MKIRMGFLLRKGYTSERVHVSERVVNASKERYTREESVSCVSRYRIIQ